MSKSVQQPPSERLLLKITLNESDPAIWRRVEVDGGMTLDDLSAIIQLAFEWDGSHPYEFMATPGGKLTRKAMQEAHRYHMFPPGELEEHDHLAQKTTIASVFTPTCKQIVYEYDFGDSWRHIVKLEKRLPGGEPGQLPVCVGGENAAPLDDVGGIYGFYNLVEALRDPKHAEHDYVMETWGDDFEFPPFDIDAINRRLAGAFKPVKKRVKKLKKE